MQFYSVMFALVALVCSAAVAYPAEPAIKFTSTPAPSTSDLDPNHVPSSVCVSMRPDHGPNNPKTSDPPYSVSVTTRNSIGKGDTIGVIVAGLRNETFKGIYIQGRINDVPVGRWLPHDNPQVRVSDCPPRRENALSYVSRNDLNTLRLQWVAPQDVTGDLIFLTTVVKSYSEFWVNVRSDPLKVVEESIDRGVYS